MTQARPGAEVGPGIRAGLVLGKRFGLKKDLGLKEYLETGGTRYLVGSFY